MTRCAVQIFEKKGLSCFVVRVHPRADRDEISGAREGALRVRITAPPVDDRANERLIAFLAASLDLSARNIHLLSGYRSRLKTVGVKGLTGQELLARMAQYFV